MCGASWASCNYRCNRGCGSGSGSGSGCGCGYGCNCGGGDPRLWLHPRVHPRLQLRLRLLLQLLPRGGGGGGTRALVSRPIISLMCARSSSEKKCNAIVIILARVSAVRSYSCWDIGWI